MTQRLYNRLQDIIVATIYQEPESFFYDGSLRVQAQMLAKFEGKTIDFVVGTGDQMKVVQGKIVRAGAVPQFDLIERYGQNYFYQMNQGPSQTEPLIEVDGKLRYGLPGTPLFPAGA